MNPRPPPRRFRSALGVAVFNLSPFTVLFLVLLAVFIFGPDRLPTVVGETARALRRARRALRSASEGLRDELGPEFRDLDLAELNPRTFVRRHLLEDEPPVRSAPAPRPAPEGWPAHVPFPSAAEMGMGPDDDPFTAPIPLGKAPLPAPEPPSEPTAAQPPTPDSPAPALTSTPTPTPPHQPDDATK